MATLTENYSVVQQAVSQADARLVAVSKTKPMERIMELYALGHRDFGENRVSELVDKYEALPKDINWHFIGHLQRNKVKYIAPFVHLIHAVDSARLLREINKQGINHERQIPVLLQYHIAEEASKYGLDPNAPEAIFEELAEEQLPGVSIVGVMGMATYTDHDEQIAAEFGRLANTYRLLRDKHFPESVTFREISMGMSGDYPIALQHGSTLVRVGSLLFGSR
ncbi:MAG: YggS family pyridoxal phosphate-dependent enzyme [Bacteroidota bacterium]